MCDNDVSFLKCCTPGSDCMRSLGGGTKCDVSEFVCF